MTTSKASARKLIKHCIECIQTYNPLRVTPQTQLEDYLEKKKIKDPNVSSFIREVFFGVERYQKFLDVTADGLYDGHSSEVVRTDREMYKIFTLLATRKLDELGFDEFYKLVRSQKPHKMKVFLEFLWADEQYDYLVNQWGLVYDVNYIEQDILGGMKRYDQEIKATIAELDELLTQGIDKPEKKQEHVREKVFTKPVPFNLTAPKAKFMPAPPHAIPTSPIKANKIPDYIYRTNLKEIEKKNIKRKKRIRAKVVAKHKQFKAPAMTDIKSTTPALKAKLEEERKRIYTHQPAPAKPIPDYGSPAKPPVNTGFILREDLFFRKQEEEKARKLREYQQNLRDDSEFKAWQKKMRAKDDQLVKETIERRRQEMVESAQRAKDAMEKKEEANRELVVRMRQQAKEHEEARREEQRADVEARQKIVEKVKENKTAAPIAVAKVAEKKKSVVEALRAEKVIRKKAREKAKKEEMKAKKELIYKIQAMEKLAAVKAKRPKEFDRTKSSGVGLLDEMSLVELHERLSLLKLRDAEAEERKRTKILEAKAQKKAVLESMHRAAAAKRQIHKEQGKIARALKRAEQARVKRAKEQQDRENDAFVKRKIAAHQEDKRQKALRLAKELHQRQVELNFVMAGKERTLAIRKEDMGRAKIRAEKMALEKAQRDKEWETHIKTTDARDFKRRKKEEKREKKKRDRARQARVLKRAQESEEYALEDEARKKRQAEIIRARHQAQLYQAKRANPYAARTKIIQARKAQLLARTLLQRKEKAAEAEQQRRADAQRAEQERLREQERQDKLAAVPVAF